MKAEKRQKIIFFTKYTYKGPSSRYRTYQYLQKYSEKYQVVVYPFFTDGYIKRLYSGKSISRIYLLKRILNRIFKIIFQISAGDILFIEYELIPYFPSIFEKYLKSRSIKFILDYDDAIFHNYDQSSSKIVRKFLRNKIPEIMNLANHVITGSPYLTEYALKYNQQVTEVPTSISITKYSVVRKGTNSGVLNIGWLGSKTTSKNILQILSALKCLEFRYKLTLIGFDNSLVPLIGDIDYDLIEWSELDEADQLSKFDVGIMPLEDTPFNRGKCGFKLIQYMACGLPTISSPLEANVKINRNMQNLYAETHDEWVDAFTEIYNKNDFYNNVGRENYKDFVRFYSLESNLHYYLSIFNNI